MEFTFEKVSELLEQERVREEQERARKEEEARLKREEDIRMGIVKPLEDLKNIEISEN
jgi:hypothetical protein